MSRILIRKALELMEDQLKSHPNDSSSKLQNNQTKSQTKNNSRTSKQLKAGDIDWKIRKNSLKSLSELKNTDRTEENLHILKQLSDIKPKPAAAQKVIEYERKLQSKRHIEPEVIEPEPESILFPEENNNKKKKKKKRKNDY